MFKKFLSIIVLSEKAIVSGIMLVISILVFTQVLTRYIFEYSTPWLEELTRFLMIWMILLGTSLAVKLDKHISIDVLDVLLKKETYRKVYFLFLNLVGILFSLFLVYYSYEVVMRTVSFGQLSGAMRIPMYFVNGSFLVCGVLLIIHYCEKLISTLKQTERGN